MTSFRLAVLPALLAGLALTGCAPTPSTAVAVVPPAVEPPRPDKPEFKVTTDAIAKEAFGDATAVSAKYKDKFIQLDGTVGMANKVVHPTGFLIYGPKRGGGDRAMPYTIRCTPVPAEVGKVWDLSQNQKVSVAGWVKSINAFTVELEWCVTTPLEPSRTLKMTAEELAAEYAKDGAAAQKKYLDGGTDRELILSGVVAELPLDRVYQYAVLTGSGKTAVKCTVAKSDWDQLKVGDKVTVKGNLFTFDDKTANSPALNACFVIKKD